MAGGGDTHAEAGQRRVVGDALPFAGGGSRLTAASVNLFVSTPCPR